MTVEMENSTRGSSDKHSSARVTYDQFVLFGDSITQGDGNPVLNFSCSQSLQYGKEIIRPCLRICVENTLV